MKVELHSLLTFALLQWAAVYVVARSAIGAPLRHLVCRAGVFACGGIYCTACVGFWAGLLVATVHGNPFGDGAAALALSGACGMVLGDVVGNYVLTKGHELFAIEQPHYMELADGPTSQRKEDGDD